MPESSASISVAKANDWRSLGKEQFEAKELAMIFTPVIWAVIFGYWPFSPYA